MYDKDLIKECVRLGKSTLPCNICKDWKGPGYCDGNRCPSFADYFSSFTEDLAEDVLVASLGVASLVLEVMGEG